MEIRIKIFWMFVALLIIVVLTITFTEKIIEGKSFSLREWFLLIGYPLLFYMGIFMAPTMRITFSDEGISVYWKIGFGPIKLWEQTKYHLKWHEVDRVYSPYPVWIPIHAIGVIGYQNSRKMRNFYLGALMTKKKESLVYIADHVKPGVIDQEVQKLIDKYRTQLEKKQARAT